VPRLESADDGIGRTARNARSRSSGDHGAAPVAAGAVGRARPG